MVFRLRRQLSVTRIWMNPTLGVSCDMIRDTLKVCRSTSMFYLSLAQLFSLICQMSLWERNLQVGVNIRHSLGSFHCFVKPWRKQTVAMHKPLDLKNCTQKGPKQGYASNLRTPEQLSFDHLFREPFTCNLQPTPCTLIQVSKISESNKKAQSSVTLLGKLRKEENELRLPEGRITACAQSSRSFLKPITQASVLASANQWLIRCKYLCICPRLRF